jgi:tetratricopeptide (TPR) repeat protein
LGLGPAQTAPGLFYWAELTVVENRTVHRRFFIRRRSGGRVVSGLSLGFMNRNAFVVAVVCLASAGRLLAGNFPGVDEALSLFKKDATEEISEELKGQLVRKIEGLDLATRLMPENGAAWLALVDAWLKLGGGNLRSEKVTEAKEAFEKALAIQPGNAVAAEGLVNCLMLRKEPEQALVTIDRSLKINATHLQLWIFRAALLTSMGRPAEGWESLSKARELAPDSRDVHAMGGFLAVQQHDLPKALAEDDLAIKIERGDASLWKNRSAVLYLLGNLSDAIKSRLHALELNPDDITTRCELAGWLSDAGRQDEAARQAQEVIDRNPDNERAWAFLGQANIKRGRVKEGVEQLLKAQSLGFDDPKALLELGEAYIGLKEFEKAEEILSGFVKKEPEDANALSLLGSLRQKQHRVEEGIRLSENALELDPKNITALTNRVYDSMQAHQTEDTFRYAKRAIEVDPSKWYPWIALGLAEEHRGHEKEAYVAYKKAAELEPAQIVGWEGVARFAPKATEAWEAGQKSAAMAPNDPIAQVLPAFSKARFGKTQEAIALLEALLTKFPENKLAAQELSELRPKLDLTATANSSSDATVQPSTKEPWKVIGREDENTSDGTMHTYHMVLDKDAGWALLTATCASVKRSPELLEAAQKAAAEHPDDKDKWRDLGLISVALSSDEHSFHLVSEAEGAFRKAVELGMNGPYTRLWLAIALCAEGRYSEAESICQKVTEDEPKSMAAWTYLGQSRLGRGRGPEAVEAYTHCVMLSPKDPNGWNLLNNIYSQMDDPKGGEKKLRALLREYPDSAMGWLVLGQALSVPDRYEDAIAAFNKSLALKQPNAAALNGLGGVFQFQGKFSEAEKEFRQALEYEPKNDTFLSNLANCLLSDRKVDEAEKFSKLALEIAPRDVASTAILTQVYIEKGDMEAASAACDRLEELDPSLAELLRGRIKK